LSLFHHRLNLGQCELSLGVRSCAHVASSRDLKKISAPPDDLASLGPNYVYAIGDTIGDSRKPGHIAPKPSGWDESVGESSRLGDNDQADPQPWAEDYPHFCRLFNAEVHTSAIPYCCESPLQSEPQVCRRLKYRAADGHVCPHCQVALGISQVVMAVDQAWHQRRIAKFLHTYFSGSAYLLRRACRLDHMAVNQDRSTADQTLTVKQSVCGQ
jgi:hypothetical protein